MASQQLENIQTMLHKNERKILYLSLAFSVAIVAGFTAFSTDIIGESQERPAFDAVELYGVQWDSVSSLEGYERTGEISFNLRADIQNKKPLEVQLTSDSDSQTVVLESGSNEGIEGFEVTEGDKIRTEFNYEGNRGASMDRNRKFDVSEPPKPFISANLDLSNPRVVLPEGESRATVQATIELSKNNGEIDQRVWVADSSVNSLATEKVGAGYNGEYYSVSYNFEEDTEGAESLMLEGRQTERIPVELNVIELPEANLQLSDTVEISIPYYYGKQETAERGITITRE
jgi:hypothetical protein